jgi:hypothetical protein
VWIALLEGQILMVIQQLHVRAALLGSILTIEQLAVKTALQEPRTMTAIQRPLVQTVPLGSILRL